MKLIFTLLFLACQASILSAQDIATYTFATSDEAKQFVSTMASTFTDEWKFQKLDESNSSIRIYLTPKTLTAEEQKKADNFLMGSGVKYLQFDFSKEMVGADEDFGIEGTELYQFTKTRLHIKDAFGVWKKYFNNAATMEKLKKERRDKVRDRTKGYTASFTSEVDGYWIIQLTQ